MARRQPQESRIVVGVDGSDSSTAALRWAARQARLGGQTLVVITAWDFPEHPTPFGVVPDLPPTFDPVEATRHALEAFVANVLGGDGGIDVRCSVVGGAPAPTLLEAAQGADLLVVGSRGLSTVAGVLLGSVSRHCVTHAACPVAIIRREAT